MTQPPDARISVLIPSYNYGHYLGEAIDSVLTQTYPAYEIIVVDDGSTDGSYAVAAGYGPPVRAIQTDHRGVSETRNRAFDTATGDYVAFLDADDRWAEFKLALQLAAFDADPSLDLVFGSVMQFHSPDLDAETRQKIICPAEPQPGYVVGAMLARAEAFRRVGPFALHWRVGEFIDWYARAQYLELRSHLLADVVMHRRLHATNTMRQQRDALADYAQPLRAALQRRRGVPPTDPAQ